MAALFDIVKPFDTFVNDGVYWLTDSAGSAFDLLRAGLDGVFAIVQAGLAVLPFWAFALLVALLGAILVGRVFGLLAAIGLWLCNAMGLWDETIGTLTLVATSTLIAVAIAIPAGILAGLASGVARATDAVLDLVQTMPPYIYLMPGIALLGYGPATAMCATIVVAVPPAMRLTAHGIRSTPTQLRELGAAVGMTPLQTLLRIRIPAALPAILGGVNQSLMLAFGMVVIAGIVGSGGLGQTIYEAVRKLEIDRAVNAGIAVVILSIILDRLSQGLARAPKTD